MILSRFSLGVVFPNMSKKASTGLLPWLLQNTYHDGASGLEGPGAGKEEHSEECVVTV